jgi:hypothetical protein
MCLRVKISPVNAAAIYRQHHVNTKECPTTYSPGRCGLKGGLCVEI